MDINKIQAISRESYRFSEKDKSNINDKISHSSGTNETDKSYMDSQQSHQSIKPPLPISYQRNVPQHQQLLNFQNTLESEIPKKRLSKSDLINENKQDMIFIGRGGEDNKSTTKQKDIYETTNSIEQFNSDNGFRKSFEENKIFRDDEENIKKSAIHKEKNLFTNNIIATEQSNIISRPSPHVLVPQQAIDIKSSYQLIHENSAHEKPVNHQQSALTPIDKSLSKTCNDPYAELLGDQDLRLDQFTHKKVKTNIIDDFVDKKHDLNDNCLKESSTTALMHTNENQVLFKNIFSPKSQKRHEKVESFFKNENIIEIIKKPPILTKNGDHPVSARDTFNPTFLNNFMAVDIEKLNLQRSSVKGRGLDANPIRGFVNENIKHEPNDPYFTQLYDSYRDRKRSPVDQRTLNSKVIQFKDRPNLPRVNKIVNEKGISETEESPSKGKARRLTKFSPIKSMKSSVYTPNLKNPHQQNESINLDDSKDKVNLRTSFGKENDIKKQVEESKFITNFSKNAAINSKKNLY